LAAVETPQEEHPARRGISAYTASLCLTQEIGMSPTAAVPIALQLFTIRDQTEQKLTAALEQVAEMGFDGVEFAGLFDNPADEVRDVLDRVGLRACGTHISLERLNRDIGQCIDEAQSLGADIIIVPYLTEEYRSREGYGHAVSELLAVAGRLHGRGLRLAYHHHNFEFLTLGPDSARRGIDILVDAPPDRLLLEIDVYWCRHAGTDPLKFLTRHVKRTPLLHLKDMRDARSRRFTEIGSGIIEFAPILRTAAEGGVEWFIVEQDGDFAGSSMDSVRTSLAALKRLCREALA
jgi:sugar phosphate isomerase/epimerase